MREGRPLSDATLAAVLGRMGHSVTVQHLPRCQAEPARLHHRSALRQLTAKACEGIPTRETSCVDGLYGRNPSHAFAPPFGNTPPVPKTPPGVRRFRLAFPWSICGLDAAAVLNLADVLGLMADPPLCSGASGAKLRTIELALEGRHGRQ